MGSNSKPDITKEELNNAQAMWVNFTQWSKYGIIFVCASLAILGLALL